MVPPTPTQAERPHVKAGFGRKVVEMHLTKQSLKPRGGATVGILLTGSAAVLGARCAQGAAPADEAIQRFEVRDEYEVTLAIDDLPGARYLEFDDNGTLFVARPRQGDITAFQDKDGDGVYESRTTFLDGVRSVVGLDFEDGWLWYSPTNAVRKARDTDGDLVADEDVEVIGPDRLPHRGMRGHWWRPVLVTEDSIYTSIGDSGNISDETDTERQKIWRFDKDGSNKRLFASGIRNTEKLRLRPGTDEIWGADHGSDNFGRELGERTGQLQPVTDFNPPDEINHYIEGGFYGHPFIVGSKIPRYEHMDRDDIIELADRTIPPAWEMPAHAANNGFAFVDPGIVRRNPEALPPDHAGDLFVAMHGSWNRVEKSGYSIERVLFDDQTGRPYGRLTAVKLLTEDGEVLGRPVDCVHAPDGSILFSEDYSGRVYRIRARGGAEGR